MGCTGTLWTRVTFSYHYTLSTFALLLTLAFWQFNLTILNFTKCEMVKIRCRCNHIDYRQGLLMAGLPKNFSDILLPDDLIWFDKCRVRGFEEMSRVECGWSSNRNRGRSNRLTRKVTFTCQSTVEQLPPPPQEFYNFFQQLVNQRLPFLLRLMPRVVVHSTHEKAFIGQSSPQQHGNKQCSRQCNLDEPCAVHLLMRHTALILLLQKYSPVILTYLLYI